VRNLEALALADPTTPSCEMPDSLPDDEPRPFDSTDKSVSIFSCRAIIDQIFHCKCWHSAMVNEDALDRVKRGWEETSNFILV
jgi:hypothetical protein